MNCACYADALGKAKFFAVLYINADVSQEGNRQIKNSNHKIYRDIMHLNQRFGRLNFYFFKVSQFTH